MLRDGWPRVRTHRLGTAAARGLARPPPCCPARPRPESPRCRAGAACRRRPVRWAATPRSRRSGVAAATAGTATPRRRRPCRAWWRRARRAALLPGGSSTAALRLWTRCPARRNPIPRTARPAPRSPDRRRRAPGGSRLGDAQWQRPRTADLSGGPLDRRRVGEAEARDPLQPDLEGNPELHPRQMRAHAAVNAEAECRVPVSLPVDDDLVGPGELRWIPVGGREGQQDPVVG